MFIRGHMPIQMFNCRETDIVQYTDRTDGSIIYKGVFGQMPYMKKEYLRMFRAVACEREAYNKYHFIVVEDHLLTLAEQARVSLEKYTDDTSVYLSEADWQYNSGIGDDDEFQKHKMYALATGMAAAYPDGSYLVIYDWN